MFLSVFFVGLNRVSHVVSSFCHLGVMNSTHPGSEETLVLSTYDTRVGLLECFAYLGFIRKQEIKGLLLKISKAPCPILTCTTTWDKDFMIMPPFPPGKIASAGHVMETRVSLFQKTMA